MSLTQHTPASDDRTRTLFAMLGTCRPHGSEAEHDFITQWLLPLGVEADGFGNLWLQIGKTPVLWSSHIDTCHRKGGLQRFVVDDGGTVRLAHGEPANCLGADCTGGVWLMTEMIVAGVEGRYVFHRGEERGGLGSRYVATQEPDRLAGIDAAIAFDRRGTSSIITHQGGERCCSDRFAASLAQAIGLYHVLDPTGTFTDTANYTDHIGECSNLSVGYHCEHTINETLDLAYLLRLRGALLAANLGQLVIERRPGEPDPDLWADSRLHATSPNETRRLYDLVRDYPYAIADFLDAHGITVDDLADYIDMDIPF